MKYRDYKNDVDRLVNIVLCGDVGLIKKFTLELTDRKEGGDSLHAFYVMVSAFEKLAKMKG